MTDYSKLTTNRQQEYRNILEKYNLSDLWGMYALQTNNTENWNEYGFGSFVSPKAITALLVNSQMICDMLERLDNITEQLEEIKKELEK